MERRKNEPDRIHLKNICYDQKCTDYKEAFEQSICACKFDPHHELIYKKCNQDYFNDIDNTDRRQIDI